MQQHKWTSQPFCLIKQADTKDHILHDSIYVIFLGKKRQNYRVRQQISGYLGLGDGSRDWVQKAQGNFQGNGGILKLDCDTGLNV